MSAKQAEPLKRVLGFWDSVAINIGIVIGVGIFRVPAEVAKYLESPFWILAAWTLGGVVSLLGVLCYAELSSRFPRTGGTYVFLREAYGRLVGFLYGWIELSILRAGSLAGVAYILTAYLGNFISLGGGGQRLVAILMIFLFTAVNSAGLRLGTGVQNVLSVLKAGSILVMAAVIFFIHPVPLGSADSPAGISLSGAAWLAPALIPILWSYGGWHESTFMSGEFRDTRRELPLSLITSILIISGLYLFINAAYLQVLSPEQMKTSQAIASDVFAQIFGQGGRAIVTVAVLISACGALNSTVLTGGRIPFAVGGDIARLGWLAKVDPKFGTPLHAFLMNGIWASILVLWGNFEQLLFFCGFAKWLEFSMVGASVFILRKGAGAQAGESYSMLGYPGVPILFTLASAILCLTTIVTAPREALFGAILVLTGVPIYFLLHKSKLR